MATSEYPLALTPIQAALKRAFDFSLALLGLLVSWWIILITFALASLDTRSNGFFIQERVGRHGRRFRVVKIKTMRPDNQTSTTVTRSGDPRITPLGRFFRKTKLDELPQLWNVLLGQMSFVGPRPDVPGFADALTGPDRAVLSLRPGITGPATLAYRDEEEILSDQPDPERYNRDVIYPDKVRLNLEYIRNWSLAGDLFYIFQTVWGRGRVSTFMHALPARIRSDMGRALARTFVARGIAALGALALALVIGRLYGPDGMGVYALAHGFLLGVGILARQGMDNGLMRYVGRDYASPHVSLYLRWALLRALVISVIAGLLLWWARQPLEGVFSAPGLAVVLVGVALAAPAYTFAFLFSGFFKGIRKPATASLLENGSVALVAGALIFAYDQWRGSGGLAVIGYAYAIAAWLVAFQGGLQAWLWCRRQPWWHRPSDHDGTVPRTEAEQVSSAQFMATSRAFFVTGLASFMQSVLGVMIAGWLLTSAELGLFKSSQQAATLIGFILIVINAIFPPRFAALYHQGDLLALGRLARQGALLGGTIAGPLLLLCLVAPAWVLGWFGEEFRQGASLLRIIALANLVNVATGSVGFLLNMTGHERLMRNIALVCNALGLVGFFLLPQFLGALGAALALAFVLITQNLAAMLFVWRRLGIWTLPGPNLFRWLGVRGGV